MTEARTYECMVLLDNREVKSNWESLHGSLQAIFTKHGAKVLSSKPWGERRLAYPIKRQTRATYLLNYLEANPGQVAGIRRDLHFNESVLRDLVLVCEQVPEEVFGVTEFDPSSVHIEDLPEMPTTEPAAEPASEEGVDEVVVEDAVAGDEGDAEKPDESTSGDEPEKASAESERSEEPESSGDAGTGDKTDEEEKNR